MTRVLFDLNTSTLSKVLKPLFGEHVQLFKKKDRSAEEFKSVLLMIKKYNIIFECYRKAEYFINLASNSLSIFDESKEKDMLQGLTSFSLERTF